MKSKALYLIAVVVSVATSALSEREILERDSAVDLSGVGVSAELDAGRTTIESNVKPVFPETASSADAPVVLPVAEAYPVVLPNIVFRPLKGMRPLSLAMFSMVAGPLAEVLPSIVSAYSGALKAEPVVIGGFPAIAVIPSAGSSAVPVSVAFPVETADGTMVVYVVNRLHGSYYVSVVPVSGVTVEPDGGTPTNVFSHGTVPGVAPHEYALWGSGAISPAEWASVNVSPIPGIIPSVAAFDWGAGAKPAVPFPIVREVFSNRPMSKDSVPSRFYRYGRFSYPSRLWALQHIGEDAENSGSKEDADRVYEEFIRAFDEYVRFSPNPF